MIYAFVICLLSGLIGRNIRRMAVTLIIVFLYGSMVWGMLPINERISWEGHLSGFITGLVLALIFTPPAPPTFSEEDDELDNEEDRYWEIDENKDKDKYLN